MRCSALALAAGPRRDSRRSESRWQPLRVAARQLWSSVGAADLSLPVTIRHNLPPFQLSAISLLGCGYIAAAKMPEHYMLPRHSLARLSVSYEKQVMVDS